jgi:hypothetical protein
LLGRLRSAAWNGRSAEINHATTAIAIAVHHAIVRIPSERVRNLRRSRSINFADPPFEPHAST